MHISYARTTYRIPNSFNISLIHFGFPKSMLPKDCISIRSVPTVWPDVQSDQTATPRFRIHQNQKFRNQDSKSIIFWLVVSTHLKNVSQIGNLPQIGVKIKKYSKPPPSFVPGTNQKKGTEDSCPKQHWRNQGSLCYQPKQCTITMGIPEICRKFALFDPAKMGKLMIHVIWLWRFREFFNVHWKKILLILSP